MYFIVLMTNSETQVVGSGRDFWHSVSDFKAKFNFHTAGSSSAGQNCLWTIAPWVPVEERKFAFALCVLAELHVLVPY